jgi:hypothetical protein
MIRLPLGRIEIADLHRKAWEGVKHRKHVTHKVYSLADDGKDILVQGTLEFTTNDGTPGAAGFIVQAIFPTTSGDLAVAKQWKIWMVCCLTLGSHMRWLLTGGAGFIRFQQGVSRRCGMGDNEMSQDIST